MRRIVCLLVGGMFWGGCAAPHQKPPEPQAVSWPIPFTEPPPPAAPTNAPPVAKPPPVKTPQVAKKAPGPKTPPAPKVIMTPETMLVGKVAMVKDASRFAVLNFPVGSLPGVGQILSVYRNGLKVGEIKITGPQMDENIIGDIVTGELQKGDEIRGH